MLVTNILDSLAEGSTKADILRSYPTLKPEHIDATIAYAEELAHEETLLPLRSDMRLNLYENLPLEIVDIFSSAGHDIETVHHEGLPGASDPEILRRVQR